MPRTTVADDADPRFEPVANAFARVRGFTLMESKSRGTRGLMLNGKSFGMSSHGRLILKLTPERVDQLVAGGVGEPFRPSAGRVMKGWIDVTSPDADWVALAKEAHRIASATSVPKPAKKAPAKKAPTKKRKARR